jgi:hypothetical protein
MVHFRHRSAIVSPSRGETNGAFTPSVLGSVSAGSFSPAVQSGTWRRIGEQVHVQVKVSWTGQTGTGNTVIGGIPAALTPVSFTPPPIGQATVANMPSTGPVLYASLNGTGTASLVQVATNGTETLVPLAASDTVRLNLVHDRGWTGAVETRTLRDRAGSARHRSSQKLDWHFCPEGHSRPVSQRLRHSPSRHTELSPQLMSSRHCTHTDSTQ